jgi:hypothetical protein
MSVTSAALVESREEARFARKRAEAAARAARFQNARERTCGVDVEFLNKQVAEKRAAERARREEELQMATEMELINRRVAQFAAEQEEAKRRQRVAAAEEMRQEALSRQFGDDADLQDPLALRKSRPMRDGDHDPRAGPASALRFDGEDLKGPERRGLMHRQLRLTLMQQQAEKLQAKEAEVAADRQYAAYVSHAKDAVEAYERETAEAARAQAYANRLANEALAKEREEAKAMEAAEDADLNAAEAESMATTGILSETRVGSTLGAHRKLRDRYRGMTDAERAKIREEQLAQIAAKEAAKRAEREADWAFGAEQDAFLRKAAQFERERAEAVERQRVANLKVLDAQRQAEEARRAAEADKSTTGFDASFFGAFGRSDR